MMTWGSDWLHEMRSSHLTQGVKYERKGKFVIDPLPATASRSVRNIDTGNGIVVAYEVWSFIVSRDALLDAGGNPVEPEVGDLITVTYASGKTVTYDVNIFGGEPPWRDHDRAKNSIVIYADEYR